MNIHHCMDGRMFLREVHYEVIPLIFLWSSLTPQLPYVFVNPITQFLTPQWQNRPDTNVKANLPMYLAYVPTERWMDRQMDIWTMWKQYIATNKVCGGIIYPNKPGIPFVGHRQTVQTQIRCHIMWHLIRIFTVCLQDFQLQLEFVF